MSAHTGWAQVCLARVLLVSVLTQAKAREVVSVVHWHWLIWVRLGEGAYEASIVPVGVAGQVSVGVGVGGVAGGDIVRLVAPGAAVTGAVTRAMTRAVSRAVSRAAVAGTTGSVGVGASWVPVHTILDRQS